MLTVTDLFAGASGSSTGMLDVPGVAVRIAANHWPIACEIHNANHPDTDHATVDLHEEDPAYFPRTDILWASPECTKWSQANGTRLPDIEEGLFEDPLSDDAKTRSRLLMFDVLRFIAHHRYRAVIVENVVDIATQAKYRMAWQEWRRQLTALGYSFRVISLNSMHAQAFGSPAPQSRGPDFYIAAWPTGERAPDFERVLRPAAWCDRCSAMVEGQQAWKNGKTVGRYRQSYVYIHGTCGTPVEPGWLPAAAAIDWTIAGERIGDRLKPKTRALAGTVAANVLAHGTGALNVDGCRIGSAGGRRDAGIDSRSPESVSVYGDGLNGRTSEFVPGLGRWPANVVVDESQAAELDAQSGVSQSRAGAPRAAAAGDGWGMTATGTEHDDDVLAGASRFLYVAKAGAAERVRVDGVAHPTVKPLTLMRWLVRLVTPPGGLVLEPFAGSGTTVEACLLEGFRCVAIEREAEYLPLIRQRIHRRRDPVAAVVSAGGDAGLFDLLGGEPA